MTTISQMIYSDAFFENKKFYILIKISLMPVLKGLIYINRALD